MRESPNYVLSGTEADAETSRLSLLEQVSDPSTMSVLARLGVRLGWRCLDVGAGHGSISRRLAEIVGPEGRVVAADIDLSHLDTGGYDNVSMRELDVAADDLGGPYDLVHARHLLVHVPNAELVVRRLVTALAPGGRLVAADAVLDPDPPIGEAPRGVPQVRRSLDGRTRGER